MSVDALMLDEPPVVVTSSFCVSYAGSISPSNMYSSRVSTRLWPASKHNSYDDDDVILTQYA